MNKNRGIWMVLICIIVVGAGVTFATRRYIERSGRDTVAAGTSKTAYDSQTTGVYQEQEKEGVSPHGHEIKETTAGAAAAAARAGAPGAAKIGAAKIAGAEDKKDGTTDEKALPDGEPAMMRNAPAPAEGGADVGGSAPGNGPATSEVLTASAAREENTPVISPLGPEKEDNQEDGGEHYTEHLNEIDAQIQKMRAETSESSTYSMKNLAEKELQMWNIEMNSIYGIITESLDSEGVEKLEKSQQTWLKSRDTKAEEVARKYSGGSLEGVEYTASLAESTRQRAYDLVAEYGEVMKKPTADSSR